MARKKFNQVSLLHVVHHGIMPLSVWPGARFVPGGHASFFGLLNTFVHIVMYFYYMMSAMGPQYQKYLWWKQHLTTLQMIQFVGIMAHGFQLVFYDDCDFPWQFSYYIGAHAVLFFVLFSEFYIANYLKKRPSATKVIMLSQMPCSSSFTFYMKYEVTYTLDTFRKRMYVMAMLRKMTSKKSTTTMSKKKSLPKLYVIYEM